MPDGQPQSDPVIDTILAAGALAAERLAADAKGLDRAYEGGTLDAWVDAYEAREIKDDADGPADTSGPAIPTANG